MLSCRVCVHFKFSVDSVILQFVFPFIDYVEQLKASPDSIKDDSIPLRNFCATFEQILLEGAKSTGLYIFVFMSNSAKQIIEAHKKFIRKISSSLCPFETLIQALILFIYLYCICNAISWLCFGICYIM